MFGNLVDTNLQEEVTSHDADSCSLDRFASGETTAHLTLSFQDCSDLFSFRAHQPPCVATFTETGPHEALLQGRHGVELQFLNLWAFLMLNLSSHLAFVLSAHQRRILYGVIIVHWMDFPILSNFADNSYKPAVAECNQTVPLESK